MQEAYLNGYWKELVRFMRSMFNAAFKTNPYLERAVLMGITRISKESIFSDLNNLKVISATSKKYETAFGFTQQEVSHALEEYGLQNQEQEVKDWYDGFRFGDCDHLYNPWSVINFLDERVIKDYWVNTSSNSLTEKLVREGSADVKQVLALTNKEVTFMFRKMIRRWFDPCRKAYHVFLNALLSGDLQAMNAYMNRIVLASVRSFDSGTKPSEDTQP